MSLSPLENHIGNANRHTTASSNLVLTSFSSLKRLVTLEKHFNPARLYQGIARKLTRGAIADQVIGEFAASLISVADHAHLTRNFDIVGSVGQVLSALPATRHLAGVGDYYHAVSLNRASAGDTVRAGYLFNRVTENAPLQYRAKAMLALGTNSLAAGDPRTAISFYHEVIQIGTRGQIFDPVTGYFARQMTAVTRAMDGDHWGALADLEGMYPLMLMASRVQPYTYYDYLNALAVELAEVGVLDRARRLSGIALKSSFALAYPNWQETFADIEAKQRRSSRSTVGVRQPSSESDNLRPQVIRKKPGNVLRLPEPEPRALARSADQLQETQARVLNFHQWKVAIKSARPVGPEVTPNQRSRMTTGEKLIMLMNLISRDETDDETIDRIFEAVEQIVPNRRTDKLD